MIFISYPRTGVNFITEAIKMQTGVEVLYSHDEYIEDDNIINIVRDPVESISSWIAMAIYREDPGVLNNKLENVVNVIAKNKYINMYRDLLKNPNTIFVNYKDFSNPEQLIQKLCKILNLEIINELDIDKIKEINSNKVQLLTGKYLITSKNVSEYENIYNMVKEFDFSEIYNLYYEALSRCIDMEK